MPIKKSDLHSSLWASCNQLRGGMNASQKKDYVLFMRFVTCVSDKYADHDAFESPAVIPKGAGLRPLRIRTSGARRARIASALRPNLGAADIRVHAPPPI